MRKYDGKDLFVTYCGWGAAAANKKLVEYAKSKYGAGSQMGPSYAMWRWAWENPEEAFPIWKEYFFERFPEEPQPTFDDFVRDLLRRGEMNRMIAVGGTKGIHNFCVKYGLETNYGFEPGDVAQIIRRGNPLFQAIVIIERAEGDNVDAFFKESNGKVISQRFDAHEIAVIGRAPFPEKRGFTIAVMTKFPRLEELTKSTGLTLRSIEFTKDDTVSGVLFNYTTKDGRILQHWHSDFEQGVDKEIEWMQDAIQRVEV